MAKRENLILLWPQFSRNRKICKKTSEWSNRRLRSPYLSKSLSLCPLDPILSPNHLGQILKRRTRRLWYLHLTQCLNLRPQNLITNPRYLGQHPWAPSPSPATTFSKTLLKSSLLIQTAHVRQDALLLARVLQPESSIAIYTTSQDGMMKMLLQRVLVCQSVRTKIYITVQTTFLSN